MKQRKTPTEAAELRHTIWTTDWGDADSSSSSNSRDVDFSITATIYVGEDRSSSNSNWSSAVKLTANQSQPQQEQRCSSSTTNSNRSAAATRWSAFRSLVACASAVLSFSLSLAHARTHDSRQPYNITFTLTATRQQGLQQPPHTCLRIYKCVKWLESLLILFIVIWIQIETKQKRAKQHQQHNKI